MKWITYTGKQRLLNEKRFLIDWDGPSLSKFQFKVKQFFKKYWIDDIVGEEVILPDTRLRVDILNFSKKIAVEVNGLFHVKHVPHFQENKKSFENQVFRDVYKEHLLEANDFLVIEIYEKNLPLSPKWITKTFGEGILD